MFLKSSFQELQNEYCFKCTGNIQFHRLHIGHKISFSEFKRVELNRVYSVNMRKLKMKLITYLFSKPQIFEN